MATTYTKLRDGSWGLRVEGGSVKAGQSVTVSKRDGASKVERVGRVLWTGNGVSLCSIAAPARERAPRGSSERDQYGNAVGGRRECCGGNCPVTGQRCTPNNPCHDCQ